MHSMNIIIMIILTACLLPYIFAIIARYSLGYHSKNNENPRAKLAEATGLAARANAAQQNSFEGLPLFIAAVLIADYLVVSDFTIIVLGIAYIVFRLIYGICYLCNLAALRSVIWLLATSCPVILLVICMRF